MSSNRTTKRKCQICRVRRSHSTISKSSNFNDLVRDMVICKIEEMLLPGKNSVTHVCNNCIFHITRCSFRVRKAMSRKHSVGPGEPFLAKCKICKVGDEKQALVVNNADRAMKLAIFKLTDEYIEAPSDETYLIFFCTTCYRLLIDLHVLLKRFYDPKLSA